MALKGEVGPTIEVFLGCLGEALKGFKMAGSCNPVFGITPPGTREMTFSRVLLSVSGPGISQETLSINHVHCWAAKWLPIRFICRCRWVQTIACIVVYGLKQQREPTCTAVAHASPEKRTPDTDKPLNP